MKAKTQHNRIGRVIEHLIDAGEHIDTAPDYAERGYCLSDEHGMVVFGDWNSRRFPRDGEPGLTKDENRMPRAFDLLQKLGCDCEWYDEWATCGECGKAVRTQPNCYQWQPSYVLHNECELVCEDCVAENPDEYFESLDGSTNRSHHISTK